MDTLIKGGGVKLVLYISHLYINLFPHFVLIPILFLQCDVGRFIADII